MNQTTVAAIALLRHMIDGLEKGDTRVYSINQSILTDQDPGLMPSIRNRLEIVVFPTPPSQRSKSGE